jgi:ribosomal protein S18 acetylase RimI-like enzyme
LISSAALVVAADHALCFTLLSGKPKPQTYPLWRVFAPRGWETEEYWNNRIVAYLASEFHPKHALMPRVSYMSYEGDSLVGFIAGHLTQRHSCDGELEWINVIPERRGSEIASELLRLLMLWFLRQKASRICVDVEPSNAVARRFYRRHGAEELKPHWMVWNDIKAVLRATGTRTRKPSAHNHRYHPNDKDAEKNRTQNN